MKLRVSVLIPLAALSLLAGCTGGPAASSPSATPAPTSAPSAAPTGETPGVMSDFTATDLDGNELDASIFADYDLTMVNVWATFCRPCIDEMPELGQLHAEYADRGFQIVGLVADTLDRDGNQDPKQVATAKELVEKTEANYLHILPSPDLFPILSQATSVPTTFFVDKDGVQVGLAYRGSRTKAEWIAVVDPLLAEVVE